MATSKKFAIDLSRVDGGMRNKGDATWLAKTDFNLATNECALAKNIRLTRDGFGKIPGFTGVYTTPTVVGNPIQGIFYSAPFGVVEQFLIVNNGSVDTINPETDNVALTNIGSGVGTNKNAVFADYQDKCWIVAGTNGVMKKLESGTTLYRVGIVAPTTGSAVIAAGGSLAVGTYKVIVTYGRKVGGVRKLFSAGYALADCVAAGGNLTVAITSLGNSSDAQVNSKQVWMTDANGVVYYFYGEIDNNTTTSINITSSASRDSTLIYSVQAGNNQLPPIPNHFIFHKNRLWICEWTNLNTVSYSMFGATIYDYERFPSLNYLTLPDQVHCLFAIREHLYFSTNKGVYRLPYGDPSNPMELVDSRYYFTWQNLNTVRYFDGYIIGLTQENSLRLFSESGFVNADLLSGIECSIKISGSSPIHGPFGLIYESRDRREYRLSFNDSADTTGDDIPTRTMVLNLDKLQILGGGQFVAPWEFWKIGFSHSAIRPAPGSTNNKVYHAQTGNNATIIREDRDLDGVFSGGILKAYDYTETFISAITYQAILFRSRKILFDLDSIVAQCYVRVFCKMADGANIVVTVYFGDDVVVSQAITVGESSKPIAAGGYQEYIVKLPMNLKGQTCYVELAGSGSSFTTIHVAKIMLYGEIESNIAGIS